MKISGLCIPGGKETVRDMKKYITPEVEKKDWVTLSTLAHIRCLR